MTDPAPLASQPAGLRPCPFCGQRDALVEGAANPRVFCAGPGGCGAMTWPMANAGAAIAAWNRRAPPPAGSLRAAAEGNIVSTQATIHGDPYPDKLAALESSLAEAVALLKEVVSKSGCANAYYFCVICGAWLDDWPEAHIKLEEHKPSCRLAAFLARHPRAGGAA